MNLSPIATPSRPRPRMHLPALDGIRGLAILMVMIYHFAGVNKNGIGMDRWYSRTLGVGWCGVDLFFVLSGFLITGILHDTKGSPGCLRNFFARRMLRIFPLYYGLLIVLFVIMPRFGRMPGVEKVAEHQLALWSYCSNFTIVFGTGQPLRGGLVQTGHFWSLAVEEQFYLVWPLLVLRLRRETLMKVCGMAIAAGLMLRVALIARGFEGIYFFTPCRLDGLMVGAWLALFARGDRGLEALISPAKWVLLASGAALGAIWCAKGLHTDDTITSSIGFTLLAAFFGAGIVLVLTAPATSWRGRVFAAPALKFFGKYSYGLYVFHFALEPTFSLLFPPRLLADRVFHHYWPARVAFITICVAISIACAWVSWHVYEKQFLKLKRFFEPAPERQRELATPAMAHVALPALKAA